MSYAECMIRVLALLTLALAFRAPSAWAVAISVDAAGNYSSLSEQDGGANDHPAKLGLGVGAELQMIISGPWGFDIGGFYMQRKYGTSVPGSTTDITTTQQGLEFPFLMRYWVGNVVSFGLGGYYFKYTGDLSTDTQPLGGGTTTTTQTYDQASQSTSDYGLAASIRFDFPLSLTTGLVLDARYELGLANNFTNSSGSAYFRDVTGFVGIRFGWLK